VIWQPTVTHALVEGEWGNAYILNLTSGERQQIMPATGYNFNHVVWNNRYVFTVRYDNSGYIVVYDLQTGQEVAALDRGYPVYRLAISPDGRFLAAAGFNRTFIWDTQQLPTNREPLYTRLAGGRRNPRFTSNTILEVRVRGLGLWRYDLLTGEGRRIFRPGETNLRPDNTQQYAFVNIDDHLYLRHLNTGEQFFLGESQRVFGEPYWDYEQGQVFTVTTGSGLNTVSAFDLQTGALAGEYYLPDRRSPAAFTFSQDHTHIIVYSDANRQWGADGKQAGAIVYALGSSQGVLVDANDLAAVHPEQVTLSPDNRYLVMGRTTLRIWDLQNLPDDIEARDPIYRHEGPQALIAAVHFVDSTILETVDAYGITQRWDLHTGAEVTF
jgi:WD40 repeat protein